MLLVGFALFIACNNYNFQFGFLKLKTKTNSLLATTDNYTFSSAIILMLVGLVFIAFSRLKNEDEMVAHIRLISLQISVYCGVALFMLLTLFTFSFAFLVYSILLWYIMLVVFCVMFYGKIFLLRQSNIAA